MPWRRRCRQNPSKHARLSGSIDAKEFAGLVRRLCNLLTDILRAVEKFGSRRARGIMLCLVRCWSRGYIGTLNEQRRQACFKVREDQKYLAYGELCPFWSGKKHGWDEPFYCGFEFGRTWYVWDPRLHARRWVVFLFRQLCSLLACFLHVQSPEAFMRIS